MVRGIPVFPGVQVLRCSWYMPFQCRLYIILLTSNSKTHWFSITTIKNLILFIQTEGEEKKEAVKNVSTPIYKPSSSMTGLIKEQRKFAL